MESRNIDVFGYVGNASPLPGRALIDVVNSLNVSLYHLAPFIANPKKYPFGQQYSDRGAGANIDPRLNYTVREMFEGQEVRVEKTHYVAYFHRSMH